MRHGGVLSVMMMASIGGSDFQGIFFYGCGTGNWRFFPEMRSDIIIIAGYCSTLKCTMSRVIMLVAKLNDYDVE